MLLRAAPVRQALTSPPRKRAGAVRGELNTMDEVHAAAAHDAIATYAAAAAAAHDAIATYAAADDGDDDDDDDDDDVVMQRLRDARAQFRLASADLAALARVQATSTASEASPHPKKFFFPSAFFASSLFVFFKMGFLLLCCLFSVKSCFVKRNS